MIADKDIRDFIPVYENFKHQEDVYELSKDKEYYALFWEMGLGKTKTLLDTACYLYLKKEIDGVIVTAPKGVYLNWVKEEIPIHVPKDIPCRYGHWNSNINKKDLKKTQKMFKAGEYLDILCINTEALATKKGCMVVEAFMKSHYTMFVIDESTSIKNYKAVRTRAIVNLSKKADYKRIATGTPITQSPLDLFSQCEFLKKGCLKFKNFFQFKHYYAKIEIISLGTRRYEKISKYLNLEELSETINPFSSRLLKEECLDLPEKIHVIRDVEHTDEQKKAYVKFKEECILEFEGDSMVTSSSVLTTIMKLHQINCGHVIDDFGVVKRIKSARVKEMVDAIEETSGKMIIWCHFLEDVNIVCEALTEKYGRSSCVRYTGKENDPQRQESLRKFKQNSRFLVATSAASKGLTLIHAKYSLYYSYGYNLETYLQSLDRNHRIGQNVNVTYIYLRTRNTVDVKVLKALRDKKNLATQVLDNRDMLSYF